MGAIDPTTQQPIIPAAAVQRILYQIFKNKGLPTEGIFPDFDRQAALGDLLDEGGLAPAGMPQDPMAGAPQLDGRSATAAAAIEQSNDTLGVG